VSEATIRSVEPTGSPNEGTSVRARRAVVLAAGRSTRLAGMTGGGSKALLRVGGLSLVERAVRRLLELGIEDVVVVVGYHAGPVAALVNQIVPGRVRAVFAENWEEGNGASLAAAELSVAQEPLFVLVTADHVFGEGSVEALVDAGEPAVLVDRAPAADVWAEGTRIHVEDERAMAFSKGLPGPAVDCGAFLMPPAIFDAHRRAAAAGDPSLAGAVSSLAAGRGLRVVTIPSGSWWHDVDTPQDVRAVVRRLRRSLSKPSDGPVSRYLNRPLSTRLSMTIAPLRVHPDLLSTLAAVVGLAGAALLWRGLGVAGAVLTQAMSVLDGMDGETARLQQRERPEGALLDGVLDRLTDAALAAGLAVWAVLAGEIGATTGVLLGVAATAMCMLSMATKDRVQALGLPPAPERALTFLLGGRDARLLFVVLAALIGRPAWALAAMIVASGVTLVARLVLVRAAAARRALLWAPEDEGRARLT
jgi:1L-myo-inositol 1-phosphate cytidylyltransferase / CDP-L-myo-inositol myo-inositolphosphotransferase